MRHVRSIVASLVVGLTAAACAGYSIRKDGQGEGYDVYAPAPYLLRKPQFGTGGLLGFNFEVVFLPDKTQRYRVHSWAGLGAADFSFTFTDGWKLTAVTDKSDNTAILSAMTDTFKHLIPTNPFEIAQPNASVGRTPSSDLMASATPILYKIEFDDCGRCVGLQRVCEWPCCLPTNRGMEPWMGDRGLQRAANGTTKTDNPQPAGDPSMPAPPVPGAGGS